MKRKDKQSTKKNREYDQGTGARQQFEKAMTALFQAPKSTTSKKSKKGKD